MGRRINRARFLKTFVRVLICFSLFVFALPLVWHTPPKTHDNHAALLLHRQQEEQAYRRMHARRVGADAPPNARSRQRDVRDSQHYLKLGALNIPEVQAEVNSDLPPMVTGASIGSGSEPRGESLREESARVVGASEIADADASGKGDAHPVRDDDEALSSDDWSVVSQDALIPGAPETIFLKTSSYRSMTHRIRATVDKALWGAPNPDADALHEASGCDIFTVPFNPAADSECLASLRDVTKWATLEALPQKYDERTIKFRITFPDTDVGVRAIIKVPQRLYPNEPYGEVAAYHADRLLGVNRIPPTALTCIPLDWLVSSALQTGRDMKLVKEFAGDSGVTDYAGWIKKDFVDFTTSRNIADAFNSSTPKSGTHAARMSSRELSAFFRRHGEKARATAATEREDGILKGIPEGLCVHASVQLFVAEAGRFLDSIFAIPYRAHDPSWHKFFAPAAKFHPPAEKDYNVSLLHISELVSFDYIIGNSDRSPNKNNFVVGGCRVRCPGGPKHIGAPDFVHLDNGLVFHNPGENPIAKIGAHDPDDPTRSSFCWFYAPFVAKVRILLEGKASGTLVDGMRARLPPPVFAQIGETKLSHAHRRAEQFIQQVDHCVKRWGADTVLHV